MIGSYFSVLFKLFGGWFLYIFGIKGSKLYYSSIYLFSKQSFRMPQSAKADLLVVFKSYFKTVKMIFNKRPEVKAIGESPVAILDSSFNGMDMRLNYLHYFNVVPGIFLSRGNLSGAVNFGSRLLNFLLITKLFSFFWLGSFSRNRVNYALLLSEAVEWMNCIHSLAQNKIAKIYMFSIYEKDCNFLAYLLMKKNIKVSKVTSEVPLTFANKIIVTNELDLCFSYQKEEVEAYKRTLFYDSLEVWFPEAQAGYLNHYVKKTFDVPEKAIGFYSSALWLRKKLNHSLTTVGSYDAEETVLKFVAEYLKLRTDINLVIFAHPYEKRTDELFKDALQYYRSIFGNELSERVEVKGKETNSTLNFDKVNVGISLFSTVMFERLNLGFKTILTPIDKTDFPLLESPFRNICAYSKQELFGKLDKNIPLSKKDFFKVNGIESYESKRADFNYILV